jgi:hypothetical protein
MAGKAQCASEILEGLQGRTLTVKHAEEKLARRRELSACHDEGHTPKIALDDVPLLTGEDCQPFPCDLPRLQRVEEWVLPDSFLYGCNLTPSFRDDLSCILRHDLPSSSVLRVLAPPGLRRPG